MRLILLPLVMSFLIVPASAEQMSQDLCDKLHKATIAVAALMEHASRIGETVDKPEVQADVGPKTREALERLAAARQRVQAAVRDYGATSAEAAERLRKCSD